MPPRRSGRPPGCGRISAIRPRLSGAELRAYRAGRPERAGDAEVRQGNSGESGEGRESKIRAERKLLQTSCMWMLERFLHYKAGEVIKVPARNTSRTCAECGHTEKDNRRTQAHFQCLACGHTDNADANAARNILSLGLNRLLAGGAPVTGRGEDNEAGAFFMECLVETANDPSTMPWNHRDMPEFHTKP